MKLTIKWPVKKGTYKTSKPKGKKYKIGKKYKLA